MLLALASDLSSGGSSSWREAGGLIRGGTAERLRLRWAGLRLAPWRQALERLALPLAAIHLAVWATGIARVADPIPLGKWWTLVLAGSALALLGAALRWRVGAAAGALALFAALVAVALKNEVAGSGPIAPPHFFGSVGATSVDLDSAMIPSALLLVLASLALPRGGRAPIRASVLLLCFALPAAALWLAVVLGGPGTSDPGGPLVAALLVLAVLTVIWSAVRRRHDRSAGVVGAAIVAVAAPEAVWLLTGLLPYGPGGFWDIMGVGVMAAGALIAPLACLALIGGRPRPISAAGRPH